MTDLVKAFSNLFGFDEKEFNQLIEQYEKGLKELEEKLNQPDEEDGWVLKEDYNYDEDGTEIHRRVWEKRSDCKDCKCPTKETDIRKQIENDVIEKFMNMINSQLLHNWKYSDIKGEYISSVYNFINDIFSKTFSERNLDSIICAENGYATDFLEIARTIDEMGTDIIDNEKATEYLNSVISSISYDSKKVLNERLNKYKDLLQNEITDISNATADVIIDNSVNRPFNQTILLWLSLLEHYCEVQLKKVDLWISMI